MRLRKKIAIVASIILALWRAIGWVLDAVGVVDTARSMMDPNHWLVQWVFHPQLGNVMTAIGIAGVLALVWELRRHPVASQLPVESSNGASCPEDKALTLSESPPHASDDEVTHIAKERAREERLREYQIRGVVDALFEEAMRLKVDVALKTNTGTPGLYIEATSRERVAIRDAAFIVTNILLWDEHLRDFVTSRDVHGSSTEFPEIEIGTNMLHPGEPERLAFIRAEGGRMEFSGRTESAPSQKRLTKPGIRKISYRIADHGGRSVEGSLCFMWEGPQATVPPAPLDCPTPASPD
ncbi:MAG: hypothetical protein ABR606_01395 [Vicinamibacterales bacterium]